MVYFLIIISSIYEFNRIYTISFDISVLGGSSKDKLSSKALNPVFNFIKSAISSYVLKFKWVISLI